MAHLRPQACDICGYKARKSTQVVQRCQDGIYRCHICREKAIRGKYTNEREILGGASIPPITHEWENYLDDLKGNNND